METVIRQISPYFSGVSSGTNAVMIVLFASKNGIYPSQQELQSAREAAKSSLESSGFTVTGNETAVQLPSVEILDDRSVKLKADFQLVAVSNDIEENEEITE